MQEPTFLILTALADRVKHGYGIMCDAERISGGRVRLRAGTLYTALDRLQSDGLVAADREEVVEGRLRRYYRLTDCGAVPRSPPHGWPSCPASAAARPRPDRPTP
jgi:DNA-binding PadR family transcriptional regulator